MSFDLTPSDDLAPIFDAAQAMLGTHYPLSRLRDPGTDPITPLAEFGTYLLALPEDAGGMGLTIAEEAQLHVALGQHLIAPSAIASAVAARIALHDGQDDLAQAILDGTTKVSAGVTTQTGALIFDPEHATHALIRNHDGLSLTPISPDDLTPETAMGHGRPLSRFTGAIGNSKSRAEDLQTLIILTAAHLLGVATGARDLATAYAKEREQFGQPIGQFQAIKHHCANMAIGVEMLSAQLDMAALSHGNDDAAFQCAALARLAPRIALNNARTGIQIHGGMGFSDEADAQLYLKQTHILRALLGQTDMLAPPSPMAPTLKGTT